MDTVVDYWKSEGRVMLEYGCPVWHSGLTSAQSHSLDRAQRAAMAAITGRWEPSHSRQLAEIGLERLSARRTRLCKTLPSAQPQTQDIWTCLPQSLAPGGSGHTERYLPGQGHITSQPYLTSPDYLTSENQCTRGPWHDAAHFVLHFVPIFCIDLNCELLTMGIIKLII